MVAEYRQLSSCDTLNQLQHRRVLVKDDNYITHTYAVLDARKPAASKGTVLNIFMLPPNLVWPEVYCFCPVRPCVRASICKSVCASRNIVNTISCRVFDTFSPNLHQ